MKKSINKLVAAVLTASLVFAQGVTSNAAEANTTVVCSRSCNTADFAGRGYQGNNNGQGPISITKAVLKTSCGTEEIYLIGLSGTDFVDGQATGILTDLVAGFNCNNPYLKAAKNAIINGEKIPAGSKLVITGHSLGGMIAQQLASDQTIKDRYEVLNTVTFGSPLISAGFREGTTKRLGDKNDPIPYLSATGAILPVWQILGLNREDGGYGSGLVNGMTAHMNSYGTTNGVGNPCWASYDALGVKGGNAAIIFDENDVHYFHAPTEW